MKYHPRSQALNHSCRWWIMWKALIFIVYYSFFNRIGRVTEMFMYLMDGQSILFWFPGVNAFLLNSLIFVQKTASWIIIMSWDRYAIFYGTCWDKNALDIKKTKWISLLPAVPKSINKKFIVFDCNWANSTAQFKCALYTTTRRKVNENNKSKA